MSAAHPAALFTCPACGQQRRAAHAIHGDMVDGQLLELLQKKRPDLAPPDRLCFSCLNELRADYVEDVLEKEKGEISDLEEEVIRSLREHELLAQNINVEIAQTRYPGERVADVMASFGGSWKFIFLFTGVLVFWIALNTVGLLSRPFDAYPYILLNLVLSCLAAIQAPIIMMSQNRQEARDRLRGENDYRVNLKAELEIRHIHSKLDQLLTRQWQRLLEIQKIQLDLMEELARKGRPGAGPGK